VSNVPRDELARAAAIDAVQLTQPELRGSLAALPVVWHDRAVAVKRELAGRTGSRGGDAAARELWQVVEGSEAVSGEEANALARRAQAGDKGAQEELIRRLLPLVQSTARRYRTEGLEQADLLVEALVVADARERSLDEPIGNADSELGTLGDLLEDPLSAEAYEDVNDAVAGEQLHALLSRLTERERAVVRARFGFDAPPEKLSQLGEPLGVSAERVRQIEERALAKLRSAA
jgi:DNA-directed RNA polymerase sigma subunit (sigma70/sigma32)